MKSLWGQRNRYLRVKRNRVDIDPKAARLVLVAILILVGVIFIAGDVGLWNLWKAQKRMKDLERRIGELEKRNALLTVEIEELRNDPFAIEKVARERYGYLRPGDRVYRIITLPAEEESERINPSSLDSGP